ncbi:MAG TPA: hypothetical protein VJP45_02670 [Candidatus Limnocylindria bacterium]|nr:hypothetical protein [Candidatus Limnocylindria bacterium]
MSDPVQVRNATIALGDDVTAGIHARLEDDGKRPALVWSCWVSGPGIKAWEDGREPVKGKGVLESVSGFITRVEGRADELLGGAQVRCAARVHAGRVVG